VLKRGQTRAEAGGVPSATAAPEQVSLWNRPGLLDGPRKSYRSASTYPNESGEGWEVFGNVGLGEGNPNPPRWMMLVGVGGSGLIPGRSLDGFGGGYSCYSFSQDLRDGLRLFGPRLGDERGGEIFYNMAITPWQSPVAATSPAIAQNKDSLVITGNHWMKASTSERQVFFIGAGNIIAAEVAYAKRHSREAPPVSDGIIKALKDLKIGDIETRITRWYEANRPLNFRASRDARVTVAVTLSRMAQTASTD